MDFSYIKYNVDKFLDSKAVRWVKKEWIPVAIVGMFLLIGLVASVRADTQWVELAVPERVPVVFVCTTEEAAIEFIEAETVEALPVGCIYGGPAQVIVTAYSETPYMDPVGKDNGYIVKVDIGDGTSGYSAVPKAGIEYFQSKMKSI